MRLGLGISLCFCVFAFLFSPFVTRWFTSIGCTIVVVYVVISI